MSKFFINSAESRYQRLLNPIQKNPDAVPKEKLKNRKYWNNLFLILLIFVLGLINKFLILAYPIYLIIKKQAKVRRSKLQLNAFERDYPTFLISLSSSMKCGLDPLAALLQSKDLFANNTPIAEAIESFRQQVSSGIAEDQAIKSFASEIQHPDLILFKDAYLLSRQQGASLSFCLHRIARVVRARQSFRRKTNTAVAMQKLSAFGILIAVVAMFSVQVVASYQTLLNAWANPIGMKLLILALSLVSCGFIGILKISNSESWR